MNKLFVALSSVALGALLLAAPAQAKGYGTAGCGLGSVLIGSGGGFLQVFAVTLNGVSGNQTFGITSGTSNCADAEGGEDSAKAFVETNRTALAKDIARGQGETINSLAQLAGCSEPAAVGMSLQRQFDQIFPAASIGDSQVGDNVLRALKGDVSLQCQSLG